MKNVSKRIAFSLALACLLSGRMLADERISQSPAPTGPVAVDSAQIENALRPLLKVAMQGDKSAPEQIASQIKGLSAKTGNDPRLNYLHGLVLLKNFRHAEAIAAMQAGADHKIFYFPIHHVLIYEQIRQKQYDAAIDSLLDLSARIGDPSQLWTSEVERLEAARWLGRMTVYLAGPCGDSLCAERMRHAEPVMRSQMPAVYQTEMDGGASELHAEHRALQVDLLSKFDDFTAKKSELLKQGEQKKLSLDTQKKELTAYEREKATVQQEQLKETDVQLASLEKQYVQLQRTHDQIVAAIASLRIQIGTTPQPTLIDGAPTAGLSSAGVRAISNTQDQGTARALKEIELQGYVIELNQNVQKQSAILKQAEAHVAQRRQMLSQLHSDTKRSQEFAHNLRRWERRLSVSQKKVVAESDRDVGAIKTRISQLSTYDSIQPQTELSQMAIRLSVEP